MKKLFYIIVLCLFCSNCFAISLIGSGVASSPPPECADGSCSGFLVCQNFEGSGYDNSESWTENLAGGTVDEDDTTATVLRGSQQLKMVSGGTTYTKTNFLTGYDSAYGHFLFKIADATPSVDIAIARFLTTSSGTLASVYLNTSGQLVVYVNGDAYPGDFLNTTDALSDNTVYHIWMRYTKSSGSSDGVFSVEFTAVGTRTPVGSGNKFRAVTDHNNTGQYLNIEPILTGAESTAYYDQILVKDSAIGTVCE